MNKSFLTTLISVFVFALSLFLPLDLPRSILMNAGLFAISGAVTNWIAIYMLFERVPFLYGSGVIPGRFEEFKVGIRELVMKTFFNVENINRFLKEEEHFHIRDLPLHEIVQHFDFNSLFDGLVKVVLRSKIGGMLEMFGGVNALEPLREGFKKMAQEKVTEMLEDPETLNLLNKKLRESLPDTAASDILIPQITKLVENRLEELTPQMVKKIVEDVIRKHLDWLVIWGGVLGALIGVITALLQWYKLI